MFRNKFLTISSVLFSLSSQLSYALDVRLESGESITLGDTRVSCGISGSVDDLHCQNPTAYHGAASVDLYIFAGYYSSGGKNCDRRPDRETFIAASRSPARQKASDQAMFACAAAGARGCKLVAVTDEITSEEPLCEVLKVSAIAQGCK